jgi:hypothetical protein
MHPFFGNGFLTGLAAVWELARLEPADRFTPTIISSMVIAILEIAMIITPAMTISDNASIFKNGCGTFTGRPG